MKYLLLILMNMCWLQVSAAAKDIDSSIVCILEFHRLESKIFNNTRMIRVLLPKEYYKKPKKSYPVLYMNDGQSLFDAKTSNSNPMEFLFGMRKGGMFIKRTDGTR
jgi:hypothetical protein